MPALLCKGASKAGAACSSTRRRICGEQQRTISRGMITTVGAMDAARMPEFTKTYEMKSDLVPSQPAQGKSHTKSTACDDEARQVLM
jgi:hypothetical protein